jgi:TRAP-type C4-dicarboxylate transport system permease small subunit
MLTFAQHSPALRIPMSFVYIVIPIASFIAICNILILIYDTLYSSNKIANKETR